MLGFDGVGQSLFVSLWWLDTEINRRRKESVNFFLQSVSRNWNNLHHNRVRVSILKTHRYQLDLLRESPDSKCVISTGKHYR
jgi:hypothetical protein